MAKKTYTAEFRAEAVRLVEQSGRSISAVAADIGVTQPTLSRWVQQHQGTTIEEGKEAQAEVARLRRELKQVTMERDFLRDAAAFFASRKP